MDTKAIYNAWLNNPYFDDAFRSELKAIADRPEEIDERFYKDLEFGTAGMRGIIGAGCNRINRYVVRKATQGFANFLLERREQVQSEQAVVIAYDSRRYSPEFAMETARVMAANGIKAYLFTAVRTTPELSFAVRHLKCLGGVMITASHNPPAYNGYKVYDETGCQLVPHLATQLVEHVQRIEDFESVKLFSEEEAKAFDLLEMIDEQVDVPYREMVVEVSERPAVLKNSTLKTVYTPLHGTGGQTVTEVLDAVGYKGLIPVPSQMAPDGEFPTCQEPNPESEAAFDEALKVAATSAADLIVATDPDCDRIGFMVKTNSGYQMISGNQIGSLFMEYLLSSREGLTPRQYVVNTIVSSDLAKAQAAHYNVALKQTLTGFKFIGEQIELDTEGFIMGYEESFGYLFAPHVRDKDAVMGTLIAVEMASYYREKGLTLVDVLEAVYRRHGYYIEETVSIKFEGKSGQAQMAEVLSTFRTKKLFDYESKIDYMEDETGLPKSNVLKYYLDAHSWVVLRPSGTEPKLKVYFSIAGDDRAQTQKRLETLKQMILEKVNHS
ncbi:phospho-sugar mutase [Fusibacter sp. JL298sf-3]